MASDAILSLVIEVGAEKTVNVQALNTECLPTALPGAVVWTTDDAGVASIVPNDEECVITGVAKGETQIHATIGALDGPIDVKVVDPMPVLEVVSRLVVSEIQIGNPRTDFPRLPG
jgi:hypothetical protein